MAADDRQRTPGFAEKASRPIVLPDLAAPTADTHAHLDMLDDPVGALARAAAAGVSFVATVVDMTEAPERTLDGLESWRAAAGPDAPDVVCIAGVHPHNATHWSPELAARLRDLVRADERVRGIGEVGLDFHYDHSPRDVQRAMMREQLALAADVGLPVTVHLREAHAEGLEILAPVASSVPALIIHCFTEDAATAEAFLAVGDNVYLSFAGPVTFKKAEQIRDAARAVPLSRVLLETDSPFLAPAPYRGQPNEPAYTVLNAVAVAEAKGLDPAEVAAAGYANARRVFGG